jgi:LCP family protein required for cell wall assembly
VGITKAEAGAPQTILILGSDRRFSDLAKNNKSLRQNLPARSDTMMLLRLDPNQRATSILSLPRDLKVQIPGHGTDKLNAAYSYGGPTLTLKTIKDFTGLQINHVVNINFGGFRDVVNAIGCVYVDVDRRYYHSNLGLGVGARYAEINIEPGYQKLCGTNALNYVRYRHTDSDLVRAARQQAFLRQAKDQIDSGSLINKRSKLIDIFGKDTQTDKSLETTAGLLSILKLALFSAGHPVRQLQFPAQTTVESLPGGAQIDYVTASRSAVRTTVEEFLHPPKSAPKTTLPKPARGAKARHLAKPKHTSPASVPGLVNAQRTGENLVANAVASGHSPVPIYFPKYITSQSRYDNPGVRIYTLHDRAAKLRHAYRIVVVANSLLGQYWGVEGTDWITPPLLQGTHTTLHRHGRTLAVYKNGSRVNVVAWHSGKRVYWVSNTLSDLLSNRQMIEIAATLTRTFS